MKHTDPFRVFGMRFVFLVLCMPLFLSMEGAGGTAEKTHPNDGTSSGENKAYTPYCGLYCLYAVMRMAHMDVGMRDLMRPEYIGSKKGSSLVELQQAAEDHGMYAEPVKRLTVADLKRLNYPLILHVKSNLEALDYDHYELFLGMEGDRLRLLNPPEPLQLVPVHELEPRWAGNGLLLAAQPITMKSVLSPGKRRLVVSVVGALAAVLGVHLAKRRFAAAPWLVRRWTPLRLSVAQAMAFGLLAVVTGFVYHFVKDAGLLSHARAAAAVQRAHQGNFIPKVNMKTVRRSLGNDTVFVDARLARDFDMGHLDGAINVPVDADEAAYKQTMADIARDSPIIVYCQSKACKFADTVAIRLMERGFGDISIYRGGWREWQAANGKHGGVVSGSGKGAMHGT